MQLPEIQTPRLCLRGWKPDDLEPFATMNADPRVMEFMPGVLSRQESDALAARIHAHAEQHGFGLWAVELRASDIFIGFVGLSRPSFDAHFTPCVEVGWRLAAEHWGKGYAIEAAAAALDYGFGTVSLRQVVSFTVPANVRSQRVMEKLGMLRNPADDFDHPMLPEGHPLRRHVLYRIEQAKWQSRNEPRSLVQTAD